MNVVPGVTPLSPTPSLLSSLAHSTLSLCTSLSYHATGFQVWNNSFIAMVCKIFPQCRIHITSLVSSSFPSPQGSPCRTCWARWASRRWRGTWPPTPTSPAGRRKVFSPCQVVSRSVVPRRTILQSIDLNLTRTLFRILGQFESQHLKIQCSYLITFGLCLAS